MNGDNFRRIDLYCKENNSLISLGITNASQIRAALLKHGISPKGTEKLLRDINEKLPEEYRSVFNYTAEKTEVKDGSLEYRPTENNQKDKKAGYLKTIIIGSLVFLRVLILRSVRL